MAGKKARRGWGFGDCVYVVVWAAVCGLAMYEWEHFYLEGRANRSWCLSSTKLLLWLASLGGTLVVGAVSVGMLFVRRCAMVRRLIYVALAALPIALAWGPFFGLKENGGQQYVRGLRVWLARDVDGERIRGWLRGRTFSQEVVSVAQERWSPEILRLRPDRVELWKDRGVVMTWGRVGHDGDRRQVFVGREVGMSPPSEMLWLNDNWEDAWLPIENGWPGEWSEAKPGVWWWLQVQG